MGAASWKTRRNRQLIVGQDKGYGAHDVSSNENTLLYPSILSNERKRALHDRSRQKYLDLEYGLDIRQRDSENPGSSWHCSARVSSHINGHRRRTSPVRTTAAIFASVRLLDCPPLQGEMA